jgi:hypothetical protein
VGPEYFLQQRLDRRSRDKSELDRIHYYLLSVPFCWHSKSQKGVNLLSTEAKYVEISEAVEELKFIYYLLIDLHIKVNLSIVVKTDNIGAIFMSENASTGFCTRHVDTRYHSVQEFIEDDFLKMILIYFNQEIHAKHTKKFLEDIGVHSTD